MHENLEIEYIDTDKIRPNPYQPRKTFDKIALEELASSIKEHGLMQPITVRIIGESYELIAGERRLKASKIIKLKQIPAIISNVSNKNIGILALIENLQREELNFIEESVAYSNIMEDYGYTQQEFAKTIGKNQSTVANKLRLLKLPKSIIKEVVSNKLTERHARALLRLPSEEVQLKVINTIKNQDLNVKKTEALIDKMLESSEDLKIDKEQDQKVKRFLQDIRLFTNTINQSVDILKESGIDAKYVMKEKSDGYEIKINIPMK